MSFYLLGLKSMGVESYADNVQVDINLQYL